MQLEPRRRTAAPGRIGYFPSPIWAEGGPALLWLEWGKGLLRPRILTIPRRRGPLSKSERDRRKKLSLNELARTLPDYAKDLRLNISSLLTEQLLTDQQKYGTFVACAHACSYLPLIHAAEAEAATKLTPEALTAAKAAASIMAMNNIYYRFTHLAINKEYSTRPAKLRMNIIGSPGIDKADFELFSLAVSAVNGCGMCIDAHEKVLLAAGISMDTIQTAARIASVMHGVARTLQAIG